MNVALYCLVTVGAFSLLSCAVFSLIVLRSRPEPTRQKGQDLDKLAPEERLRILDGN
jgi:hypothetical protein